MILRSKSLQVEITDFRTFELKDTKYIHPYRISYVQNGKRREWEAVKSHDSVAILLYHEPKDSFLLVKQFRPPVYMNDRTKLFTYELCAGIMDKNKDIAVIAQEEIDEECGFHVPVENLRQITSFYNNVGVSGSRQYLFYATIDDTMKIHEGGGVHTEQIELFYLPVKDSKHFMYDQTKAKTPGLMFAFYWFFDRFRR